MSCLRGVCDNCERIPFFREDRASGIMGGLRGHVTDHDGDGDSEGILALENEADDNEDGYSARIRSIHVSTTGFQPHPSVAQQPLPCGATCP